ncbi:cardioactive peptide, partial [Vespula squamosa]
IIRYLFYIIPLIFLIKMGYVEGMQNKRDISNAFSMDETYKMKRPFCNAFTGCGRKRSFHGTSIHSPFFDSKKGIKIRLPIPIYKTLINAASEEIRNMISRDSNDYELPEITQDFTVFPDREMALDEIN